MNRNKGRGSACFAWDVLAAISCLSKVGFTMQQVVGHATSKVCKSVAPNKMEVLFLCFSLLFST